jgi:hypothetical protein
LIAALFVETGGCYFGLPDVDPWDEARDARFYRGPWPIVAHPPCARWGRYWGGHPRQWPRLKFGDDGGCFAAALRALILCGGVLEHPADSGAWNHFGLPKPDKRGGWRLADGFAVTHVEQGWYGHKARKATWLLAHEPVTLPDLRWGSAPGDFVRLDEGFHSAAERARATKTGACQRLSRGQRLATPPEFRDVLLGMVRS